MNHIGRTGISMALAALLSACGGGGGDPDTITPTDPTPSVQNNIQQVNAPAAWSAGYTGAGVTVAVIDTGARTTHEAIADAIATTYNAVDGSADVTDVTGHGTHVASIVGGSQASGVGVAPGVTLLPIKDERADGTIWPDDVASGINFATAAGVKVLNISQTVAVAPGVPCEGQTYGCDSGITDALFNFTAAGGLVVVPAGNDGGTDPQYLGYYADHPYYHGNVIVVGGVNVDNTLYAESSRAGIQQDNYLVAPATAQSASNTADDSYTGMSGTSFAAPHVAGAIAIIWSKNPALTAQEVKTILLNSATDLGAAGVDAVFGHGLLNVATAVQ